MKRKEFLKRLGFGTLVVPLAAACGNSDVDEFDNGGIGACKITPSETAGPFPTKDPSGMVLQDIRSDRTGIETNLTITISDKNNSCAILAGVIVDIWHCDKDGYYSEYGGTGLQSINLQSVHFLRGRQTTNASGQAAFKTIFPGWYPGRAPHIHVHIYDSTGRSLLVTQIAFPTDVCDTVYTTATQFYTKGEQDTSNTSDGVFRDSLSSQLTSVSGSVANGYEVTSSIVVGT